MSQLLFVTETFWGYRAVTGKGVLLIQRWRHSGPTVRVRKTRQPLLSRGLIAAAFSFIFRTLKIEIELESSSLDKVSKMTTVPRLSILYVILPPLRIYAFAARR